MCKDIDQVQVTVSTKWKSTHLGMWLLRLLQYVLIENKMFAGTHWISSQKNWSTPLCKFSQCVSQFG